MRKVAMGNDHELGVRVFPDVNRFDEDLAISERRYPKAGGQRIVNRRICQEKSDWVVPFKQSSDESCLKNWRA